MHFDIITIFPDYFEPLKLSLIAKASDKGIISFRVHNLRDYTFDLHKTVDDKPYGGGAGMVMIPEPWGLAFDSIFSSNLNIEKEKTLIVFTSPAGILFNQSKANSIVNDYERIVFCCGRYEGIDFRVYDYAAKYGDVVFLSLGDYVLNGGEVAALAIIETISRLIPGVIGNPDSLSEESHEDNLLEYPIYTKPSVWRGLKVPDVLISGNHKLIEEWRMNKRIEITKRNRPDMYDRWLK